MTVEVAYRASWGDCQVRGSVEGYVVVLWELKLTAPSAQAMAPENVPVMLSESIMFW